MTTLYKHITLFALITLSFSCTSVKVVSDYDKDVNFNHHKTFAFFKPGIDNVELSDLDKKRILRAIETELLAKGLKTSQQPDLLISIFTTSREHINVYRNNFGYWGYQWGWSPWYWNTPTNTVSKSIEGELYIDIIDAKKKTLIWQGKGSGYLNLDRNKKEERIKTFVTNILEHYPPKERQ